jgi:hypothetical protein
VPAEVPSNLVREQSTRVVVNCCNKGNDCTRFGKRA